MRRVLISLFWNPARTARSCWYPEGEIVKSDKSPSQIRDRKFRIGRMVVQLQISDLGFKMQDSSDFKIPSHRARLVKYVDPLCEEGMFTLIQWPVRFLYMLRLSIPQIPH